MDADEIRSDPAFDSPWYYNLELAPDLFTNGHDHWAVGQTRDLLRRVTWGPRVATPVRRAASTSGFRRAW